MADGKSLQGFFGCFLFQESSKLAALRWREGCPQPVADEADKFLLEQTEHPLTGGLLTESYL